MYLQKCGFWQALTNKANQELNTEERATKCVGPTATGDRLLGVLALGSGWSLSAFSYCRHKVLQG